MEQFSLDKWLQDKSRKIITRNKRNVRIICTDSPDKEYPIVGFVEGDLEPQTWNLYGEYNNDLSNGSYDLFFADEEEELTEFEKAIKLFVDNNEKRFKNGYVPTITDIKTWAEETLRLARKELLKDLPKWKKITEEKQNYLAYGYLSHDGYYLSIQELKDKLLKEE